MPSKSGIACDRWLRTFPARDGVLQFVRLDGLLVNVPLDTRGRDAMRHAVARGTGGGLVVVVQRRLHVEGEAAFFADVLVQGHPGVSFPDRKTGSDFGQQLGDSVHIILVVGAV